MRPLGNKQESPLFVEVLSSGNGPKKGILENLAQKTIL